MTETNRNEFIEIFRPRSAAELADFLRLINTEKIRAVVLVVENSLEVDESISDLLKNFEIPVILALKSSADEKFVDACHLCVAAENTQIGRFSAAEALKSGLINKLTDLENAETEARALAERISELAPLAIRACLKAVTKGFDLPLEEGLKIESGLFSQIFSTEDTREGTQAFLEKRKPVFTGK